MDINKLFFDENEKPLDNLVSDGGFVGIFRTIACIGDSLSSGEFQVKSTADGSWMYLDKFDYSWGQYLARMAGSTVYNFSRGGMKAVEYRRTFANAMGYWSRKLAADAYIIALGVNDIYNAKLPIGSTSDICHEDYERNADSFIGNYAYIIQRYREMAPDAPFFLMTTPNQPTRGSEEILMLRDAIYALAKEFENCYVIDLYEYAPVYDEEFRKKFFLNGHMSAAGYLFTAKMVASYIDYIIRHNMESFKLAGLAHTEFDRTQI